MTEDGANKRGMIYTYIPNNPDCKVKEIAEYSGYVLGKHGTNAGLEIMLRKMLKEGSIYTTNTKKVRTFRVVRNYTT